MDICLNNEGIIRRCYKCEESVLCKLNIVYNACNSTITLWNKFQIYVYEDLELNFVSKVIVPEFQIHNLIMSNNYLICMDYAGNVHTTSLKFKNAASQKRFKGSFQPRANGIIACSHFTEDSTICLKYEADACFLSIHRINSEFKLEKLAIITCNELLPFQKRNFNYILKSFVISETHIESVIAKLKVTDLPLKNKYNLVLISLDRHNVYACLFNAQSIEEDITLVKLYTCPSQISDIDIINNGEINIIIGLQTGTIVSLNFRDISPKIIHLNTAIHKFMASKDYLIYTDGESMWKAENILADDAKFCQLFVKHVNDFIKFGDQIVCITFDNLIYTFSLEDEGVYVNPRSAPEYCPVEKLFANTQYLNNILVHVKDNDALLKMQKKERDYIMALSISSRQDVMDTVINQKLIVYESYEDAITANTDLMLTNNICEYFDTDSFYFFINITTLKDHRLGDILSNDIGDIRLHITFNSENKIIKTNTINIKEKLDTMRLLIPLKSKFINSNAMRVDIKIVTNVPAVYHSKHKIFSVLYRKSIILNSEHFIKFNNSDKKIVCLKEPNLSLDKLILEAAKHQYNTVIELTNMKQAPKTRTWYMYVRLPAGYQNVLKNEDTRRKYPSNNVQYYLKLFTAEDFLQSKSSIYLTISNERVKIETYNDGFSNPCLKVSSQNLKITFDIRNFLANLIYSIFSDFGPEKEFINLSFYITVENLQKTLKECVNTGSEQDILHLIEQFERKVIGALPI